MIKFTNDYIFLDMTRQGDQAFFVAAEIRIYKHVHNLWKIEKVTDMLDIFIAF